jgi:preprotein translocase subunit SecE
MNTLKWAVTVILVILGIAGNYYFSDQSLLIRMLCMLGVALVACAIALQTHQGKQFWCFVKDSRLEIKRVVWPTRAETIQITGIVLVMVTVLGAILWAVDSVLLRAIGWLTGYGA